MATPLYRRHSPGLAATYADLENHALSQGEALFGTPGSVTLRSNGGGVQFWVRQYYDFERRKRDEQIQSISGPQNDVNFGSQIRSYVLQPYQMVKDERTRLQVGDVDSVLDGDIDEFMEAFLRDQRAKLAEA